MQMRDFSYKIAANSTQIRDFGSKNAANSMQIRDFSSKMQQIARKAAPDWKKKKKKQLKKKNIIPSKVVLLRAGVKLNQHDLGEFWESPLVDGQPVKRCQNSCNS